MPQLEMANIARKFRRLSSMGPEELTHRLCEKGYSELERIGFGSREPGALAGMTFKSYLSEVAAKRFYRGTRPEHLREVVRERTPQWIERAVDEAEALCAHED